VSVLKRVSHPLTFAAGRLLLLLLLLLDKEDKVGGCSPWCGCDVLEERLLVVLVRAWRC